MHMHPIINTEHCVSWWGCVDGAAYLQTHPLQCSLSGGSEMSANNYHKPCNTCYVHTSHQARTCVTCKLMFVMCHQFSEGMASALTVLTFQFVKINSYIKFSHIEYYIRYGLFVTILLAQDECHALEW